MAFDAAIAGRLFSSRWLERIAFALGAVGLALSAAAWISDYDQSALASASLPEASDRISFEERFLPASSGSIADTLKPLERSVIAKAEQKVKAAKDLLARRLIAQDYDLVAEPKIDQAAIDEMRNEETRNEEARPPRTTTVPLPRSRPVMADLEARPASALAQVQNPTRSDDRTLLQKLSDLLPGKVTLASLAPNGGLFHRGPDLAALGYDNLTAVYDISAHAVYLPNGTSLEAHSGMGSLRDDPEHISVRMAGATPPAVYDLKPRETLFHGVAALRLIPTAGSDISGRSGLLAHSFMLGPNGDSNGCVSIKDYDRFLKAYNDGEINRLVVVPSLNSTTAALQRSTT
jgi:hypothetical protein